MQVRILVLISQPSPLWQQLGPVDIPAAWTTSVGGREEFLDAMLDAWLRQVRAQFAGVRVLASFDGGDWREW